MTTFSNPFVKVQSNDSLGLVAQHPASGPVELPMQVRSADELRAMLERNMGHPLTKVLL